MTGTHGGKRAGAGRPSLFRDPVAVTVKIERGTLDDARGAATAAGVSLSAWVRRAIAAALRAGVDDA